MSKSVGILIIVVALAIGSAVPAFAWKGGYGYRGYGYRPYGYYRYRAPSVVVVPRLVVPFGVPYVYPPVAVAPPPVYVQPPPPQPYWYYCDNPPGYYPYVQQCSGGWRQVNPVPPG